MIFQPSIGNISDLQIPCGRDPSGVKKLPLLIESDDNEMMLFSIASQAMARPPFLMYTDVED
jgi:hypothetical protein